MRGVGRLRVDQNHVARPDRAAPVAEELRGADRVHLPSRPVVHPRALGRLQEPGHGDLALGDREGSGVSRVRDPAAHHRQHRRRVPGAATGGRGEGVADAQRREHQVAGLLGDRPVRHEQLPLGLVRPAGDHTLPDERPGERGLRREHVADVARLLGLPGRLLLGLGGAAAHLGPVELPHPEPRAQRRGDEQHRQQCEHAGPDGGTQERGRLDPARRRGRGGRGTGEGCRGGR